MKRALAEGYEVRLRVAEIIAERLCERAGLSYERSWKRYAERQAPSATAFALRDLLKQCAREAELPDGWQLEIGRIVRFELAERKFTGVLVDVWGPGREVVLRIAVDFEAGRGG